MDGFGGDYTLAIRIIPSETNENGKYRLISPTGYSFGLTGVKSDDILWTNSFMHETDGIKE